MENYNAEREVCPTQKVDPPNIVRTSQADALKAPYCVYLANIRKKLYPTTYLEIR